MIASGLAPDAVIAYDSALLLQRPWKPDPKALEVERLSFLTATRPIRISSEDITYAPVRPARALGSRWRNQVATLERFGVSFSITALERTLVDLLDRIDLAPPPLELWEAFAFARPDADAMVVHALALDSATAAARLGFFLERLPYVAPQTLRRLEKLRPSSPTYFDRRDRDGRNAFLKRWNLVVPSLVAQTVERTEFRRGSPTIPTLRD